MTLGITSGSIGYDRQIEAPLPGLNKKIIPGSLTHMFTNDLWVRKFVLDCAELFGLPTTSKGCASKKDRFLFAYGLMSITGAMRRMDSTWRAMYKKKVDPKDAAWEFCRRFFEKYGEMVVVNPQAPPPKVASLPAMGSNPFRGLQSLPSGSGR